MSSSSEVVKSPMSKAKDKFNESLLTNAFDDCLKLVQKSVNSVPAIGQVKGTPPPIETPKKVKKDLPPKVELTNKSRKFRYSDEHKDASPSFIMPPPPIEIGALPLSENQDEAQASMLMSWYMAGYHTGYYEAMRKFNK